jgi:N utilization substance protein A
LNNEEQLATVVVPDKQLSLAIGREGQNARLAAKLTGWRIDIKSLLEAAGDAVHHLQSDVEFASMAETEAENIPRVETILAKKAEGRPITPEEYQFLSQFVDRVERGVIYRRTAEKLAEEERRKEIKAKIPTAAFAIALEDLALSERIYDLLSSSGYETIGDLMFQLALDEDAVLGISGIGPKAMDEIKEKLTTISFPTEGPEVPAPAVIEQPEQAAEEIPQVETPTPEVPALEQPVVAEEMPVAEAALIEEATAEPELIVEAQTPAEGVEGNEPEPEKPVDFNEIFAMRPEILVSTDSEEEEEEEDLDKKGKKKKKKKKFVEVVYDPDRDITLVKRKRKRNGDWEDDWE